MHQANVEIVDSKFTAEAIEISPRSRRIACPSFSQHSDFVAGHVFKRLGDMRMAAISIGRINETQPMIVAIEQQIRESLHPKRGLIGMMPRPNGAGSHRQPAGLDASAAESNDVGSRKLRPGSLLGKRIQEVLTGEPGGPKNQ